MGQSPAPTHPPTPSLGHPHSDFVLTDSVCIKASCLFITKEWAPQTTSPHHRSHPTHGLILDLPDI